MSILPNLRRHSKHPLVLGTFVYGLSSLCGKAIPFVLLPVLTRYLTPAEFGVVSTVLVLQSVLSIVIDFGMSNWVGINYFSPQIDRPLLVSDATQVILGISLIALPIAMASSWWFMGTLGISTSWVIYILIAACARSIISIQMMIWQLDQKAILYALLQNAFTLAETALILLLVIKFHQGWEGRIGANLVVSCAGGAFSLGYLWRRSLLNFKHQDVSRLIKVALVGSPMILHGIGGWIITSMDRTLISTMVSTKSTGIYSVSSQLVSVIGFSTLAFNQAWSPYLYKSLASPNNAIKQKLVRFTYTYALGLLIVCILYWIGLKWLIPNFIDVRYHGAIQYLPWMLCQAFFWGMYYMVTNYIFLAKRTKSLAFITISCGVLSYSASYFLIKLFGPTGAAMSGCFCAAIYLASVWVFSAKVYPMPWLKVSRLNA